MARNEKGSRIKGLPPKLRMQKLDYASGSFPTKSRTTMDNRRGRFSVLFDEMVVPDYSTQYTHNNDLRMFDNLVLWWRFDESTTTAIKDFGNGNHQGVVVGSVSLITNNVAPVNYDRFPNTTAIQLQNAEEVYDIGNYSDHNLGLLPNFTVGGWVKQATAGVLSPLFAIGDVGKPEFYLLNDLTDNLMIVCREVGNSGYIVHRVDTPYNVKSWNHIVVQVTWSFGSLSLKVYINGVLTPSTIYTTYGTWMQFANSSTPFRINRVSDIDEFGFLQSEYSVSDQYGVDTKFDDVFFYSDALTAAEVLEIYNPSSIKRFGGLNLGACLPSSSLYLNSEIRTGLNITSASLKNGIGDRWISRTPGEDIMPFNDSNHPEMDGMITYANDPTNTFYAIGSRVSEVGPGFQQALWNKTKFEINLTPSSPHSFGLINFSSGSSYSMAYFNKTTGLWTGVGSGVEPINYFGKTSDTAKTSYDSMAVFLDEKAVGFGSVVNNLTINSALVSASHILGNPIDNFGFPYHRKYSGDSNTRFAMSDYISEPFLLEKIVIYTSASLDMRGADPTLSLATFFILNETRVSSKLRNAIGTHEIYYMSGAGEGSQVPRVALSSSFITSVSGANTTRDLVTWLHIGGGLDVLALSDEGYRTLYQNFKESKELNFGTVSWSGQLQVSGSVKSPIKNSNGLEIGTNFTWPNVVGDDSYFCTSYREQWNANSRSGLEGKYTTKRDWKSVVEQPEIFNNALVGTPRNSTVYELTVNKRYSKVNPYILHPKDELIFGWHISGPLNWNYLVNGTKYFEATGGPQLTFSELGIHKIVFYGSLLRVSKDGNLEEYHDTLNQHLTSISINETIG